MQQGAPNCTCGVLSQIPHTMVVGHDKVKEKDNFFTFLLEGLVLPMGFWWLLTST